LFLSRRLYYRPYRVTLITALITPPLPLPILLPLLFNPSNPPNPSNYIESFITITGRITRGGGSSYVSSSRAIGKAPAIPQKQVSKASSSRRKKRLKTTADTIKPESLTYYKLNSNSKLELLPPLIIKLSRIKLCNKWYCKASNIAS